MSPRICLVYFLSFALAGNVLELTDSNFDEMASLKKPVLVSFYSPNCEHCMRLEGEYEKLGGLSKGKEYSIAKLDVTRNQKVVDKYSIRYTPMIVLFIDGKAVEYMGKRMAKPMVEFIERKIKYVPKELSSKKAVQEVLKTKGFKCILASDKKGDRIEFDILGKYVEGCALFQVSEGLAKEIFPNVTIPSTLVLNEFSEQPFAYTGSLEYEPFIGFFDKHRENVVAPIDEKAVVDIFQKRRKKAALIITPDNIQDDLKRLFIQLADSRLSVDMLFLIAEGTGKWGQMLIGYFGIQPNELPVFEFIFPGQRNVIRRRFEGEMNYTALVNFVDFSNGGQTAVIHKGEKVTESKGRVVKVVRDTYEKEVVRNDSDVVVMFYVDWCDHCAKLKPIYHKVAEMLKDNKELKFTEINAGLNEIDGLQVKSFPMILLYSARKKGMPAVFEGERTEKAIIEFIASASSNKVTTPRTDL